MPKAKQFAPTPPRQGDQRTLNEYLYRLFQNVFVDKTVLVAEVENAAPATLNPDALPDPTEATIAQAQQVANAAYALLRDNFKAGTFTVSGASASAVVQFSRAFADTNYFVTATRRAITGAPAVGSDQIATITKATNQVTFTTQAAPGVGNSVSFDFHAIR